jgi:beta-lactamase regulating signal transducer with metallopeptidase domain
MTSLSPHLLSLLNVASAAVLAAFAALLVCRLVRRASASVRHALLVAGLLLILGSPALVALAQYLELGLLRLDAPAAPAPPPPTEEVLALVVGGWEPVDDEAPPWPEAGLAARTEPAAPNPAEPGISGWTVTGITLAALWAAGAVWGLGRLIRGYGRVRGLVRSFQPCTDLEVQIVAEQAASRVGLRGIPEVGSSALVPVPLVVGLIRPRVILPESMLEESQPAELEAILLHEFAHIVRRDPYVALAQRLAGALFWWCPLVHRLNRRLGELREDLCDNFVLQHQGGRAFARLLVELAERLVAARALVGTVGLLEPAHGGLEGRIRRLLQKERDTMTALTLRGKGLAALFLVLTAGLLSTATVLGQDRVEKPKTGDGEPLKVLIINQAGDPKQPTAPNPKEIEQLIKELEKTQPEMAARLRQALHPVPPGEKVELHWKVAPAPGADSPEARIKVLLKQLEDLKAAELRGRIETVQPPPKKVIINEREPGIEVGDVLKVVRQPVKVDARVEDLVKQAEAIKPGAGAAIRKIFEQPQADVIRLWVADPKDPEALKKAQEKEAAERKKREAEIEELIKKAEAIRPGSGAELRKLLAAGHKVVWETKGQVVPVVPPQGLTPAGKPVSGDQREQLKKEIERTIKQLEELRRQLDERKP